MKKIKTLPFFLLLIALTTNFSFAQDLITKKSGEDVKAKVIEVTTTEIKYKKAENINGPLFTILKSDVLLLRYENGSKDVFDAVVVSDKVNNQNIEEVTLKAKADAKSFYKGNNSGAVWTATTAILTSPLLGLIPAALCSSSEPGEDNLKFPDSDLMRNTQYNNAYKDEAHKIKKRKVWTSFGIGSGAWLLLVLLL